MHHRLTRQMTEYGLSVSLNNSPRTPRTPSQRLELEHDDINIDNIPGAPHKPPPLPAASREQEEEREGEEISTISVSVSPRVLFPGSMSGRSFGYPRQRLDFSSFDLTSELSPVSFTGSSSAAVQSRSSMKEKCHDECECSSCSVGECSICYSILPLRANHIFTRCGHLFCVRCLLKWWDTATTCPICRADIFEQDNVIEEHDEDLDEDIVGDDGESVEGDVGGGNAAEAVENNGNGGGVWVRRHYWNGQDDHFESTDEEPNEEQYISNNIPNIRNIYNDNNDSDSDSDIDDRDNNEYHDNNNRIDDDNDNNRIDNNRIDNNRIDNNGDQDDDDSVDDAIIQEHVTLVNRYLYQDNYRSWSGVNDLSATDPCMDDTVYFVTHYELRGLRENREIAMTLFARMRFRETLFDATTQFLGTVQSVTWVPKYVWVSMNMHQSYLASNRNIMYEFVIRRHSDISPFYEVSMFGFIREIAIQQMVEYYNADDNIDYYDWENLMEYSFIADVFTPTDFRTRDREGNENALQSYGSYNMNEGTITTEELIISFSQIRRLYRITGHQSM